LYRQLGELYNARGTPKDLRAAREIFTELCAEMDMVQKKDRSKLVNADLKNRLEVLQAANIPDDPAPEFNEAFNTDQRKKQAENVKKLTDPNNETEPLSRKTLVGVSLGFGFAAGMVGLWQIQEILRRVRRKKVPG
jgi:hypothetical protein